MRQVGFKGTALFLSLPTNFIFFFFSYALLPPMTSLVSIPGYIRSEWESLSPLLVSKSLLSHCKCQNKSHVFLFPFPPPDNLQSLFVPVCYFSHVLIQPFFLFICFLFILFLFSHFFISFRAIFQTHFLFITFFSPVLNNLVKLLKYFLGNSNLLKTINLHVLLYYLFRYRSDVLET